MFECLVLYCYLGAVPAPVVPDGAGGYVPFTNSRVLPDGELRPYDPVIDGPVPVYPMPRNEMPPGSYPPPPGSYPPPPNAGMWVRPYPYMYPY